MSKAEEHWQAWFDSNYFRWFDLNDYPALVKITNVERKELVMRGGIKNNLPVITFEQIKGKIESMKPMVINKTNMATIAGIAGTNIVREFLGAEVVLYPTTCEMFDKDLRRMVTRECIRIRAKKVENG